MRLVETRMEQSLPVFGLRSKAETLSEVEGDWAGRRSRMGIYACGNKDHNESASAAEVKEVAAAARRRGPTAVRKRSSYLSGTRSSARAARLFACKLNSGLNLARCTLANNCTK